MRSAVEFPELKPAAPQVPWWTLRCVETLPATPHCELLGEDVVTGDVRVRMYRDQDRFRIAFDDTGTYEISGDGRRIDWLRPADVSMEAARADLTSRVLAAALHAAGCVSLHASSVVVNGRAIAFIAPKHHGKSTLALSLVKAGARLLTDDTLPVEPGPPAVARAGLHSTRLWEDSAALVALGEAHPSQEGAKRVFSALPDELVTHDEAPLDALYLLSPTLEAKDGKPAWRTKLNQIESAMVMLAHSKLAPLLGGSERPALFRAAASLAQTVPVYKLNVLRDFDRLPEVVDTIDSWHSEACEPATEVAFA